MLCKIWSNSLTKIIRQQESPRDSTQCLCRCIAAEVILSTFFILINCKYSYGLVQQFGFNYRRTPRPKTGETLELACIICQTKRSAKTLGRSFPCTGNFPMPHRAPIVCRPRRTIERGGVLRLHQFKCLANCKGVIRTTFDCITGELFGICRNTSHLHYPSRSSLVHSSWWWLSLTVSACYEGFLFPLTTSFVDAQHHTTHTQTHTAHETLDAAEWYKKANRVGFRLTDTTSVFAARHRPPSPNLAAWPCRIELESVWKTFVWTTSSQDDQDWLNRVQYAPVLSGTSSSHSTRYLCGRWNGDS